MAVSWIAIEIFPVPLPKGRKSLKAFCILIRIIWTGLVIRILDGHANRSQLLAHSSQLAPHINPLILLFQQKNEIKLCQKQN
jgi:hypothetical protein